jgi:hypothetical protein
MTPIHCFRTVFSMNPLVGRNPFIAPLGEADGAIERLRPTPTVPVVFRRYSHPASARL